MPPILACLTTCYGRFGATAAIEHVRDAGLEYVELPIRTEGVAARFGDAPLISTASSLADLNRVDQLLERNGVRVASCNAISGNPLQPRVVETIFRKLDLASHFGVTRVVIDAGSAEDAAERQTLLGNLRTIGDYAARLGQTVCFETHRGLCVNHREMLETMRELAHPNLRLNFDTGNLLYYNENVSVEVGLAKCCHFVKHLHLKDSMGQFGQWYFPALGSGGGVDFLRVYQIMRDCGFPGPYSIEIGGIEGEPELTLEELHARVVTSVKYLRELGYFD